MPLVLKPSDWDLRLVVAGGRVVGSARRVARDRLATRTESA
jgi:hypothetical protein